MDVQTFGLPPPEPTYDDLLSGGDGNDTMLGGWGNDTLHGDAGNDSLVGGVGDNLIYGGLGSDTIRGDGINPNGTDVAAAGESYDDTIHGGDGADLIHGGLGQDEIHGDVGNDTIYGGAGNDTAYGGIGDDLIHGDTNAGPSTLPPRYQFTGGLDGNTAPTPGPDAFTSLISDPGSVTVNGDTFADRTAQAEIIIEYTGTALRTGNLGVQDLGNVVGDPDVVYINLSTFLGNFAINGGGNSGPDDTLILTGVTNVLKINATQQLVQYIGADGALYNVTVTPGTFILQTFGAPPQEQTYDDLLFGDDGNDTVLGGWGNDTINGDAGSDSLVGGVGDDLIYGGLGSDTIHGDKVDPNSTLIAQPGQSYSDTIYGGDDGDVVYGGLGNDEIHGDAGADLLYGGVGDDTVFGGIDNDTISGDTGAPMGATPTQPTFTGGLTGDTAPAPAPGAFTHLISGLGSVTIDGDSFADRTVQTNIIVEYTGTVLRTDNLRIQDLGNTASDPDVVYVNLSTFLGNFTIDTGGNSGPDDTLILTGVTNVTELSATQQLVQYMGSDGVFYEVTVTPGTLILQTFGAAPQAPSYNDVLHGGEGDDLIDGGWGNDEIHGDIGADTLAGGDGADTIYGGDSDDLIYGDFDTNLEGTSPNAPPPPPENLDFAIADGGNVQISMATITAQDRELPTYVTFEKQGTNALTSVEVIHLGNANGPADVDVARFDLTTFNDNFTINVKTEGVDDILIVEGATNVVVVSATQKLVTYIGSDGNTYTATVNHGVMQFEAYFRFDPDSMAGTSDDLIFGGEGNDTVDGGYGTDTIQGGGGDDVIVASEGNDSLDGGVGADTYTLASSTNLSNTETLHVTVDQNGNGTAEKVDSGSTDQIMSIETFIAGDSTGDVITLAGDQFGSVARAATGFTAAVGTFTPDGGGAPIAFGGVGEPTFEQLLSGNYDPGTGRITPVGTYSVTGGVTSGTIGTISFENFETINLNVLCFGSGTLIDTPTGRIPVEALQVGDLVTTLDGRTEAIRWTGHRKISAAEFLMKPKLRPIRLPQGCLGGGLPERDLVVSPQHRMLIRSRVAERMFESAEVLVPARKLVGMMGIHIAEDIASIDYWHILCDQHEVVLAEGAPSETLFTGPEALKTLGPEALEEIFAILPELALVDPKGVRPSARPIVKGPKLPKLLARISKNRRALLEA
jgi:Ca2+-binding RTX toxin-like protein